LPYSFRHINQLRSSFTIDGEICSETKTDNLYLDNLKPFKLGNLITSRYCHCKLNFPLLNSAPITQNSSQQVMPKLGTNGTQEMQNLFCIFAHRLLQPQHDENGSKQKCKGVSFMPNVSRARHDWTEHFQTEHDAQDLTNHKQIGNDSNETTFLPISAN